VDRAASLMNFAFECSGVGVVVFNVSLSTGDGEGWCWRGLSKCRLQLLVGEIFKRE
jgi:hypothetical protein